MIRRYRADDLNAAAAVFTAAFAASPWNEEWSVEISRTRIKELMSSPQSIGYVYEDSSGIKAILCGRRLTYLHGPEYVIDEFCVSPELHRSGIGTAVLGYATDELKKEGVVAMALMTVKGYPSEKFYIKNGFEGNEEMIFMYRVLDKNKE